MDGALEGAGAVVGADGEEDGQVHDVREGPVFGVVLDDAGDGAVLRGVELADVDGGPAAAGAEVGAAPVVPEVGGHFDSVVAESPRTVKWRVMGEAP